MAMKTVDTKELEEGELSSDNEFCDSQIKKLVADEADRKRLAQMTEIEREEELYIRAERAEADKMRRAIHKRLEKERMQSSHSRSSSHCGRSSDVLLETSSDNSEPEIRSQAESTTKAAHMARKEVLMEKHRRVNDVLQLQVSKRQKLQEKESRRQNCLLPFDDETVTTGTSTFNTTSVSLSSATSAQLSATDDPTANLPYAYDFSEYATYVDEDGYLYYDPSYGPLDESWYAYYEFVPVQSDPRLEQSGDQPSVEQPPKRKASKRVDKQELNDGSHSDTVMLKITDVRKIQLSSDSLEQWVHMPFFDELLPGCFVRVTSKESPSHSGKECPYQCGLVVKAIESEEVYDLKHTRTNKALVVHIGNKEETYNLLSISNAFISREEFDSWYLLALASSKTLVPSVQKVEKKHQEIRAAYDYRVMDNKVLEAILESKRRFHKRTSSIAVRKAELTRLLDIAETNRNLEDVQKYEAELRKLEEEAEQAERQRHSTAKKSNFVSMCSRRAHQENLSQEEEHVEQETSEDGDLFQRMSTRPCMFNKGIKDQLAKRRNQDGVTSTASLDQSAHQASKPTLPITPSSKAPEKSASFPGEKRAIPSSHQKDDSLHQIHNFDINLELLDAPNESSASCSTATSCSTQQPEQQSTTRRSLNLEEYKKKRGLI